MKPFSLILLFALLSSPLFAQHKLIPGIELGLNEGSIINASSNHFYERSGVIGPRINFWLRRDINSKAFFQLGLGYTTKGFYDSDTASGVSNNAPVWYYVNYKTTIHYFIFNPGPGLNLDKHLRVIAGPFVGYIFFNKQKFTVAKYSDSARMSLEYVHTAAGPFPDPDAFKKFDYGFYIGAGYCIKDKLLIKLQWDKGLSQVYKYTFPNYSRSMSLDVCYYFR
jgi:hypothetical protein